MTDILHEIEELAEKALCCEKEIPYKVQKALSQIIVKARTYAESTTSNNSGKKQGK